MQTAEKVPFDWVYDLYRATHVVAQRSLREAQQHILSQIVHGFDASSGCLAITDDDADRLTIVAGIGLPDEAIGQKIQFGEGVLGWAADNDEALLLNGDLSNDTRFRKRVQRHGGPPASSMCWPLKVENRVIGAFSINRRAQDVPFTERDLANGGMLVHLVSLVVEDVRLQGRQQRHIDELSAINAQLRKLMRVVEQTPGSVMITDRHGIIEYVNPAFESAAGYTQAEVMGKNAELLRSGEHDAAYFDTLWRTVESGKTFNALLISRKKSGELLYEEMTITPLRDEGNTISHYVSTGRDVTERRRVEAQLQQSEKLASLGQLAAGVAHEINNPVGYIYSNLSTLQTYIDDLMQLVAGYEQAEVHLPAEARDSVLALKKSIDVGFLKNDVADLVRESKEGAVRVKQIVQDLKDFSRVEDNDWHWADLHRGLESTLNIVRNELKYKAEVVKEYGELPEVECVLPQINQVFMNLLVNAAQAIQTSGRVTVRSGTQGEEVWVEVEDTGKGIAPEHLERVFDPFFTTKPVGSGTGLGLSLSYGIVKKHGGRIDLDSTVGKGSRFRVWLPISQNAHAAQAQALT